MKRIALFSGVWVAFLAAYIWSAAEEVPADFVPADFPAAHFYEADSPKITLAWDPNPEPDLAGYRLYIGKESGNYTEIYDVGNVTTATIARQEGDWFFALTAYNEAGLESLSSNEIAARVTNEKPPPLPDLKPPGKPVSLTLKTAGENGGD